MTDQPIRFSGPASDMRAQEPLVTERYITSVAAMNPGASHEADLESLVLAAMQTVTNEQVRELQARMAEFQARAAAKQRMRHLQGQIIAERARLQGHGTAYSALVDEAQQAITAHLSETDDLSASESLRLQMAMDRMSKMMTVLSNMLKKMSDTANTITQNFK
jgi:hypothetical protein